MRQRRTEERKSKGKATWTKGEKKELEKLQNLIGNGSFAFLGIAFFVVQWMFFGGSETKRRRV